jgi:hypothetical protein
MVIGKSVVVRVQLSLDEKASAEELGEMTHQLNEEILQLNVDSIEPVRKDKAPGGTKGSEMALAGQLLVTLAPTLVGALFDLLKSWKARKASTPVRIKLTVGDVAADIEFDPATTTPEQLSALVAGLEKSLRGE